MCRLPLQFYAIAFSFLLIGCNETGKTSPPGGVATLARTFGSGDPNPGQMIVIAHGADGKLIHLPQKPYRVYLGAKTPNDPTSGYEEVSIFLYNMTKHDFQVRVVEEDDQKHAIKEPGSLVLPAESALVAGYCVVTFKIESEANVGAALGPYKPGNHRYYRYVYRIDLIDPTSLDTLRIDPELVIEGRP